MFIISVLALTATAANILPGDTSPFQKCVAEVTRLHLSSENNGMYIWNNRFPDVLFAIPKTSVDENFKSHMNFVRYHKYDYYILALTESTLNETFMELKNIYGWNAGAKFFIAYDGDLKFLFKTVSPYFVRNILVLKLKNLYTYHPYKYENFNNPETEPVFISTCDAYDARIYPDFIEKIPRIWRNSTVRIAYMHLYPFIICAECGTGLEVQVVSLMQWFFQFKVEYSRIVYKDWGFFINGSYTGAIGDVYKGVADFVIGHFHLREQERVIDFDTTFSYMDDDVCWTVPRAEFRSHWENIINIFSKGLWIAIFVMLVISSVTWYYMSLKAPNENKYSHRLLDSIEAIYVNTLGLPVRTNPKSITMQLLFIVIWIFFFIITTSWKAYLINSLTHETYGFQISNLKELVKSNLILGIYTELRDLHGAEGTPEGDYVYRYADPALCDATHWCLDRTAFKKDMATIATLRMFSYLIPQRYRTLTGRDTLYVFKQALIKDYTVQYYTKGHPLFNKVNNFLIWVRTSGFINNIDNQLNHDLALSNQKYMATIPTLETKVLSMREMQTLFYILGAGLLLAFASFVCECMYYKLHFRIFFQTKLYYKNY